MKMSKTSSEPRLLWLIVLQCAFHDRGVLGVCGQLYFDFAVQTVTSDEQQEQVSIIPLQNFEVNAQICVFEYNNNILMLITIINRYLRTERPAESAQDTKTV